MSSLDQSFEKNDFTQTLHERQVKRVYLMTYAQANLNEFPTCQVFSEKLLEFFSKDPNDNNPPTRWVCCQEIHTDRGKLCHVVVQFKSSRRWLPIKKFTLQQYGVNLHFSSQDTGYVTAYMYICKKKSLNEVHHSSGRTNLTDIVSPRTKKCMKAF